MIQRELARFLLVGSLTVVLDFLVYRVLIVLDVLSIDPAKAAGFIAGTLFAYVANRFWTFDQRRAAPGSLWRFALVYAVTLVANVAVNAGALLALRTLAELRPEVLPAAWPLLDAFGRNALGLAFLVATACSATLNFLGMRAWVFRASPTSS